MRILVVGGTSFVGRAIALDACEHGHDVTVLNRGRTPSDLPDSVHHLVGDRNLDFAVLNGLSFDVTVDATAYRPRDVEVLAEALGARGGHYIQISSISAYDDPGHGGATEQTLHLLDDANVALDGPITGETYGPLKAACERAGTALFEVVTMVRPTYVIGGHDATLRFPYWVQRARRGGDVAVPGPRDKALQYIDARDLGAFVLTLAEGGVTGAFHALGPYPAASYIDVVEQVARRVAPPGTRVVEVDPELVQRRGLGAKFPLWGSPQSEPILDLDPSAAIAAGLRCRDLDESIDDVVSWWGDRAWPEHWLGEGEELELLRGDA